MLRISSKICPGVILQDAFVLFSELGNVSLRIAWFIGSALSSVYTVQYVVYILWLQIGLSISCCFPKALVIRDFKLCIPLKVHDLKLTFKNL